MQQWAYEEGQKAALRSLGIKDDTGSDLSDDQIQKLDSSLESYTDGMYRGGTLDDVINGDPMHGDTSTISDAAGKFFYILQNPLMWNAITSWTRELGGYIDQYQKQGLTPDNSQAMSKAVTYKKNLEDVLPKYQKLDKSFSAVKEAYNVFLEELGNLKS